MSLSFAEKPTLVGDLVLLRPVTVEDTPGLIEMLHDEEGNRLTGTLADFDPDVAENWYATRAEHDDRLDLAVVERASGAYVGEVVLNELDADNRACGFRISLFGPRLRPRLRHRGHGSYWRTPSRPSGSTASSSRSTTSTRAPGTSMRRSASSTRVRSGRLCCGTARGSTRT
jgi:hypothetical protein